ncbi:MAG: hypothetical protein JST54_09115 [Deltaproteobacteria bacterium]|nr:hypothetical protein [Deltaproteobacteria bacterium]
MRSLLVIVVGLVPALAFADATPLTSLDQVQKLCAELQTAPNATADAKAARTEALKRELKLTLPPGQYRIAEADPSSNTLSVDTEHAFRLFKGAAVFYPVDEEDLDLAVPEGKALPADTHDMALELVVRPGQDTDQACAIGLAHDYVMGVEILSARLVNPAGATVAAMEEDESIERTAKAGGTPTVEIVPAVVEGSASMARQVTDGLQGMRARLMECYQHSLQAHPTLDGSMVLGFDVSGGKPGPVTVMADSVQDDAMAACVSKTVSGLDLKGAPPPAPAKGKKAAKAAASESGAGRASVALRFERK